MQTWFFELNVEPPTLWQLDQLRALSADGPVSLSPHTDGWIMAAVEADRLIEAFALARTAVDDAIGKRPHVTALHGALEGTVADVVYRAAAKLCIDESTILEAHLAEIWARTAYDMAIHGAIDEQHLDSRGNLKRRLVVRPTPWNETASTEAMPIWELIYVAAKAYLEGDPTDGTEARA